MVQNRYKIIFIIVCFITAILCNSCIGYRSGTMPENDKLSIKREPYEGDELRIEIHSKPISLIMMKPTILSVKQ